MAHVSSRHHGAPRRRRRRRRRRRVPPRNNPLPPHGSSDARRLRPANPPLNPRGRGCSASPVGARNLFSPLSHLPVSRSAGLPAVRRPEFGRVWRAARLHLRRKRAQRYSCSSSSHISRLSQQISPCTVQGHQRMLFPFPPSKYFVNHWWDNPKFLKYSYFLEQTVGERKWFFSFYDFLYMWILLFIFPFYILVDL